MHDRLSVRLIKTTEWLTLVLVIDNSKWPLSCHRPFCGSPEYGARRMFSGCAAAASSQSSSYDKYKRSLAENENLRMRMQKQIEEARVFGIQKFCKDLLDVADVLSSALSSVPKEAVTPDNPHLQNLYTGLEMTEAQLQTVFRRHGLTQLNPVGMKFDPNEHQAVFVHHDETKEPGTVAVVSKIGYKLKDRTIRPAMVGVVERT
ncbi:hypothetical protein HPB50_006239 [Hyalomma asiaticum]|uniref:Uncharacterized protein n=1 Tax=Hyalomma asiaticum TaxID=266040 RepID=A0ACB7TCY1_HYAAI|nr:hypothetical protein HPB50_006239 [Hyalomma asiaticum]